MDVLQIPNGLPRKSQQVLKALSRRSSFLHQQNENCAQRLDEGHDRHTLRDCVFTQPVEALLLSCENEEDSTQNEARCAEGELRCGGQTRIYQVGKRCEECFELRSERRQFV